MKKILFALLFIPSIAFAEEQIIRHLDEDGITRWRDVYSGPSGPGYVEGEEKTVEGQTHFRTRHVGPEQREDTGWEWVEVKNNSSMAGAWG